MTAPHVPVPHRARGARLRVSGTPSRLGRPLPAAPTSPAARRAYVAVARRAYVARRPRLGAQLW